MSDVKQVEHKVEYILKTAAETNGLKTAYIAPKLKRYGKVNNMTLGPSIGTGESGAALTYKPAGSPG